MKIVQEVQSPCYHDILAPTPIQFRHFDVFIGPVMNEDLDDITRSEKNAIDDIVLSSF